MEWKTRHVLSGGDSSRDCLSLSWIDWIWRNPINKKRLHVLRNEHFKCITFFRIHFHEFEMCWCQAMDIGIDEFGTKARFYGGNDLSILRLVKEKETIGHCWKQKHKVVGVPRIMMIFNGISQKSPLHVCFKYCFVFVKITGSCWFSLASLFNWSHPPQIMRYYKQTLSSADGAICMHIICAIRQK